MIDYHCHLEKGELSKEWADRFLQVWHQRGITEFGFSEHAYLFQEMAPLYQGRGDFSDTPLGRRQRQWFESKAFRWSLLDYLSLLEDYRAMGVDLKIGLEIDWFPGCGSLVKELLAPWPLDYCIGSVHWLDGWAFDLWPETWAGREVSAIWQRYFSLVTQAVESGTISILGHADVVKIFGHYPQRLPLEAGLALARALAKKGVAAEINPALHYRGHSLNFCPDPWLLQLFFQEQVMITLGSDAHQPDQAGLSLDRARDYARSQGWTHGAVFTNGQVTLAAL